MLKLKTKRFYLGFEILFVIDFLQLEEPPSAIPQTTRKHIVCQKSRTGTRTIIYRSEQDMEEEKKYNVLKFQNLYVQFNCSLLQLKSSNFNKFSLIILKVSTWSSLLLVQSK